MCMRILFIQVVQIYLKWKIIRNNSYLDEIIKLGLKFKTIRNYL